MEVDGISVEAAETLRGLMIDTIVINGAGHQIFTRMNGEVIDAGLVRPAPLNSWPVGSIYFTNKPENPAAIMGGGVWAVWGAGRVPVGVSTGEVEFNTVEKTGGAKTHTLSMGEMPYHNHTGSTGGQSNDHTHVGSTSVQGPHYHEVLKGDGNQIGNSVQRLAPGNSGGFNGPANTAASGEHAHSVNLSGATQDHTHAFATSYQGGGVAHNNIQPYITCYMWKRLPDVGP